MQNDDADKPSADNDSGARTSRTRRRRRRQVADNTVPSPCVSVCRYNDENICEGCLRTPDEIREWMIMSREQKLAVLELLRLRRQSAVR